MSYILDALRRADAERERGAVPGLHSQPVAPAAAAERPGRKLPAFGLAAAALAALVLIGAIAWTITREPTPVPVQAASPAPPAPPVTTPAAAQVKMPPPVVAAPKPARAAVAEVPREAPASQAAPAQTRIPTLEQLPGDVRRQLPTLVIGGAIYSENATSRMLIVGGQLLHEGDAAAPGVTLEQIRQHSAVLRWKDLRYEVAF